MEEKLIYQNKNEKVVRLTDMFGGSRYILFDADGNYLRDIPSVFCVEWEKYLSFFHKVKT